MVKDAIKDYFCEDTALNLLFFKVWVDSSRACWIVMIKRAI